MTRKGDKRPNHESQKTDAQGTQALVTTLYVLCGLQEGMLSWVTMMDMTYLLHLIDLLAKLYRKQLAKVKVAETPSEWFCDC